MTLIGGEECLRGEVGHHCGDPLLCGGECLEGGEFLCAGDECLEDGEFLCDGDECLDAEDPPHDAGFL